MTWTKRFGPLGEFASMPARAGSRKPVAVYEIIEIIEVAASKREAQFRVRVTTATRAFTLPDNFRDRSAARQACAEHLVAKWRIEALDALDALGWKDNGDV